MNTQARHRNRLAEALLSSALFFTVLLCGCAGAPEEFEEPPAAVDPSLMERSLDLIERGAPEHLQTALRLLEAPSAEFPSAAEMASLAAALFDLLYPELEGSEYLPYGGPPSGYNGRYHSDLDRARSGQAPDSGSAAVESDGGGSDFFDRVAPALFIARLQETAGKPSAPGLSAYLDPLRQAETLNPASVLPPYLQGRIYELQGSLDRAAAMYRDSVARAESFYPGRRRLAELLIRRGQVAEAAALLERNLALLPADQTILYPLAEAYYRSGRLEEASAAAARILVENADDAEAMLLRARVLAAEGSWDRALRILDLLLYQHPENREAYLFASRLLYEEAQDSESALEMITEAEVLFPQSAEFPELAGRIYLETGRSGEGLNQLQKALDLEPGRVPALKLLFSNALRMQRWLQAAIYLSEILEQEQTDEDLLRAIELYENLGDSAQVLHYAEQLYEADPSGQNLVIYTRALIADGRSEQASPLVEKGLEQSESSAVRSSLLTLRASLIEGESPAEAYTLLREAVMENPENVAALIGIADLYVEQRELRKATLYLKVALTLDPENTALRVRLQSLERALESEPSL